MVDRFCCLLGIVYHPSRRTLRGKLFGIRFGREEGNANNVAYVPSY